VFSYPIDALKKTFTTDFSVVVLIRDSADQVVKKLSQHYALTGPSDKVEAARQGDILLYRETQLAPGRYKIEAVAYDALTSRAGVGVSMVEVVPGDSAKPRLSSVVLIKRAERVSNADQNSANPFRFGEVLIYPNVGEPVRKSVNPQLALFLTVYPSKETPAAPKIRVELLREGKSLALSSADLPAADAAGRIQYASTLPVERLQPGDYELKVTVRDQHSSMTRLEHFTLEP
jgi:5-hydroxyisourate hydrolase-like protein (transthyretin family)